MTQVVFANNYAMDKAFADVAAGVYPRQHLYGADALRAAGYDVVVAPFGATRARGYRLGDVRQEARALGSLAYAGDPNSLAGLAYLRALRLRRRPLVAVVHSVPRVTVRTRLLLRGYDALLCLSTYVRDALRDAFGVEATFAAWGPALDFAGYVPARGDVVVSSGKTNRDQPTLLRALDGLPGVVYARSPRDVVVPAGVELVTDETHEDTVEPGGPKFSYGHVLKDLVRASVVAIPLRDPYRVSGLSELNDALALGKPVVVTRTPHLADVDVEAIGCGIWVEPGDVDGWRTALSSLCADPALRAEMGARGRAFAESSWHADLFGAAVVDAVRGVS